MKFFSDIKEWYGKRTTVEKYFIIGLCVLAPFIFLKHQNNLQEVFIGLAAIEATIITIAFPILIDVLIKRKVALVWMKVILPKPYILSIFINIIICIILSYLALPILPLGSNIIIYWAIANFLYLAIFVHDLFDYDIGYVIGKQLKYVTKEENWYTSTAKRNLLDLFITQTHQDNDLTLKELDLIYSVFSQKPQRLIQFYSDFLHFSKNDLLKHSIINSYILKSLDLVRRSKTKNEGVMEEFSQFQRIYWHGIVKTLIDLRDKVSFQNAVKAIYLRNIPRVIKERLFDFNLNNQREALTLIIEAYLIYNQVQDLWEVLHHEQKLHCRQIPKASFLNFECTLNKYCLKAIGKITKEFKFIYFLLFYFILEFLKKDKGNKDQGKIQEEAKKTLGVLKQYGYFIPNDHKEKLMGFFKNYRSFLEPSNTYKTKELDELEKFIRKFADALEVAAMDQTDN